MKYVVAVTLLCLFAFGSAALAEPIWFDSDSAPVNLEIACWVFLSFEGQEFYLEVEPGQGGGVAEGYLHWGNNCPAYVWGELTPPPGAPGNWDFGIIYPWYHDWYESYYGNEWWDWVGVRVDGLTILDPAGVYPGGLLTVYVSCEPPIQ